MAQRLAMRRGRLSFEQAVMQRERARREALGAARLRSPRFLVRVDEYPHWLADDEPLRYGTEAFEHFHGIMQSAGVPYLLAVVPQPSQRPLDPRAGGCRELSDAELSVLRRVRTEGVELAVHGLDHRTRDVHPRRQSELLGRSPEELRERVARADELLAPLGERARVFVPPWNRFDAGQWPVLSERYDVVCGGPESVMQVGFHGSPTWWHDAVYLPSYAPFYEHAQAIEPAARRAIDRRGGGWIPIVLHWGWEAEDGWHDLEALARTLSGHAAPWSAFLAELDAVREVEAAFAP
jgi:peptidoglycan/xylan/chitin deacetylase (PgdA/CDA1 family)